MSTLPKVLYLTIVNWSKFNPRKELKSTRWMRLNNDIFSDPQFFEFEHSELLFFIYLLALASQKYSPDIHVNVSHAIRIGKFQKETIRDALQKLKDLQIVRERVADDTSTIPDASATIPTNERTQQNTTNKTDDTCTIRLDTSAKPNDTPTSGDVDFDLEDRKRFVESLKGNGVALGVEVEDNG